MLRLLLALLALALTPAFVSACACCDGGLERTIIGWSASGNSALVQMRTTGCQASAAYEVWQLGDGAPRHCFDRYGDPERAVSCESLTDAWELHEDGPDGVSAQRSHRASTQFPLAPLEVPSRLVHATLTPATHADDEPYERRMRLDVFVDDGGALRPLFARELFLGRPEDYSVIEAERSADLPIAVRVWPSPNGRVAIVEVRGENTEPGMGFFPDVLSFVSLASPLPAEAPVATSPGTPAARVVGARGDTRAARHFIRRGLDAHRGGDFERSSMLFAKALLADPGSAGARYDLACALARRGNLTAALVLLRELRAMDCPRCRELLGRASSDPDLEPLRARLP
ncbi:MAG: tetratricopeptide repeat protein [Polyangiales bacterium]|nr:tetratricopeptide repeat protein [Sandaracinus sp.]